MAKKLTLKYALKNKMKGFELVKHFKPDWTDEECSNYLWENTCFPFSNKITIEQLNNQFLKPKP